MPINSSFKQFRLKRKDSAGKEFQSQAVQGKTLRIYQRTNPYYA